MANIVINDTGFKYEEVVRRCARYVLDDFSIGEFEVKTVLNRPGLED